MQTLPQFDVCSGQVPVFQRGGSMVCRSAGSGTCTADFQQLPLTVTVALNSQVTTGAVHGSDFFYISCSSYLHNVLDAASFVMKI